MSSEKRERVLGIHSELQILLGCNHRGKPTTIPSAEGPTAAGKMFPSVVALTKGGQLLVGEAGRRQAIANPEGTIREIKRKMGTNYKVNVFGKEYTTANLGFHLAKDCARC